MKKPIILLVLFVVLAVAVVLVGPGFVNWERYKDQITARIGTATGLRVAIDGDMDLALLPRPTFKASGVRIADVSQAVTPDMASVDALEVQVSLMPLLGGEIQVQRVALLRPVLTVESQPDGGWNWSLGPDGAVPAAIRLERVNIQDGVLLWRDAARGRQERIEDIDISLSAASLSGPIQVVGTARLRDLPVNLDISTGRVTAAGALPLGVSIGLQGVDGVVRLAGIASVEAGFQGEISGETNSLGAVIRRILPNQRVPPSADQPFALEAAMRLTGDLMELSSLSAGLGEGSATGSAAVSLTAEPRIDLALEVNRIDLEGAGPRTGGTGAPLSTLPEPLADFVLGGFVVPTALSATVDIAVDAIALNGALIRQARVEGAVEDGVIAVSRLTAQLPGGSDLALAGTLRAEGGAPQFDFDAQAAATDLRALLEWLGYTVSDVPSARLRRFTGSASIAGRLDEFQIAAFDVVVDGTRATGGLAYVDRGKPGIGLRLEASRVNLDAYRPPGATRLLHAATLDRLAALLATFDANLDVTMAGLTVDGLTLRDLRLDATVNGGAVTIRRADIGDAAGASLSLTGSVGVLVPLTDADVAFTFAAGDLPRLHRALSPGSETPVAAGLDAVTVSGRIAGAADRLSMEILAGVAGGTLELGGDVNQPWTDASVDLSIRARHPDLQKLLADLRPDYRPAGPLGALDFYGEVVGTRDALTIDSLQGTVGTITLAGHCRVDGSGDRPFVEAVLRTSAVSLDHWAEQSQRAAGRSPRRWSNQALDISVLSTFDGSLALTATDLTVGALHLAEPSLEARLSNGTLDLSGLSGRLFGGTLGASGQLAAAGARPTAQLSLDLVGADLGQALGTTAGVTEFVGTLDFGLDVETVGVSAAELVSNLDGSGLFAARDGRVESIDLAETAAGLVDLTDPLGFLDLQRQTLSAGSTAYASLNATFALTDGVAATEDVRLVSQHGAASGRGIFDLSRWQIDLTTEFDLTGVPDAPPFGLRLIGPPDDPERVLQTADLQAYIARRAAEAVTRRYEDGGRPAPEYRPPPAPQAN